MSSCVMLSYSYEYRNVVFILPLSEFIGTCRSASMSVQWNPSLQTSSFLKHISNSQVNKNHKIYIITIFPLKRGHLSNEDTFLDVLFKTVHNIIIASQPKEPAIYYNNSSFCSLVDQSVYSP